MNSLSWLIYWIGLLDALNTFFGLMLVLFSISVISLTIGWIAVSFYCADPTGDEDYKENQEAAWNLWKRFAIIGYPFWIVFLSLHLFVPSRQTVLLIAGSELSEKVINSEQVQSVVNPGMDLLKTWIAGETDRLKKQASGENGEKK